MSRQSQPVTQSNEVTQDPPGRTRSSGGRQYRLLHVFPSFDIGGSQTRFVQLVKGLGTEFHHLVLSLSNNWQAAELLEEVSNWEKVREDFPKPFRMPEYRRARQLMRDLNVDLLVTYNWGAVDFAIANRLMAVCPHVDMQDGFGPEEVVTRLLRRNLFRFLSYSGASTLVAPSRMLENIARREWHLPKSIVRYLPNGIDLSRFSSSPDPALVTRLGLDDPGLPVIGTVATLRPEKNLRRLIDAFNLVREHHICKLVIIGDGALRDDLESYAASTNAGGDIVFAGRLNNPEAVLGRFDIYALSSDTEQMPFSLLEAMASKCAVASVDVGDIANMVSPDNRAYICEKSAGALADQISTLLQNPDLTRELGLENSRFVAENFDENVMFARYREVFLGAVKGRQSA
ncbi:glycosyltransferase family 4 protein [Aestuariispira insulae]|uniref:Glycosyltransferase involved in cell wall biosynthesis n=1 Tax=Aestuariispira insulae TaxID=1461337 RepID=A0A3D9HK91_9PROT|nr:glycosyltransferase family 4 protein [Aestuariispira insulae]RED49884.1 glycosyltransferase involved in cell wall biosynthesis [Aestuariispira insulae]